MKAAAVVFAVTCILLWPAAHAHFDHGVGGEKLNGTVELLEKPVRSVDSVLGFNPPPQRAIESAGLSFEKGLTVSAWVFAEAHDARKPVLTQMSHGLGEGSFVLFATGDPGAGFQLRLANGAVREVSGFTLPVRQWFHYAATFDGESATVYVDGSSVASAEIPGQMALCRDPIFVGFATDTEETFGGLIDDLGIWVRALSVEDVARLANRDRIPDAALYQDFESPPHVDTIMGREGRVAEFQWRSHLPVESIPAQVDSAITISSWVYNRGVAQLGGPIIGHWGADVKDRSFVLYSVGGDGFGFRAFWDDGAQHNLTVVETPTERWFHYAATYDGREMRVYVNGVPLGRTIAADKRFGDGGAAETWIGGLGEPGISFKGFLDEVFVWDTALSGDQLKKLAEGHAIDEITDPVYENAFPSVPEHPGFVSSPSRVTEASLNELAAAGDLAGVESKLSGEDAPARINKAFWWASTHSRRPTLRYLAKLGANVNAKLGYGGHTALHAAVRDRRIEMVQLLIELGADVNLKDDTFDGSVWGWAGHFGYAVLKSYLLDIASESDLWAAIEHDAPEHVDRLLLAPDRWDVDRATRRAAILGRPEILTSLIGAGGNPSLPDRDGRTSLDFAITRSHYACVDILRDALGQPVDGDASFASRVSALEDRIREGDLKGVRRTLPNDPDVVRADPSDDQTWLRLAVEVGGRKLVKALIQAGADIGRIRGEHSALSWAATIGAGEAANELVAAGAEYDLFAAAGLGDLGRVTSFFVAGGLVDKASVSGSTRTDEN